MTIEPGVAARAHRAIDSLHALVYFAPEADEEFTRIGLSRGRMGYFASRAAPMGPVSAGTLAATFYNFSPALVARHIPQAWAIASVKDILAARLTVADRALRRLLGDAVDSPEVAELRDLVRAAGEGLVPDGRPLYAAHAELDWPSPPHVALWHAITLLREHRGDGHIAALVAAPLSGLDALITHTATGRGFTVPAAKATRGWSDAEWDAGVVRLTERGLLAGAELSPAGLAVREAVEVETDRLATAPWVTLGPERTARLTELGKGLTKVVAAAGAFPAGVFASPR